jgi:hypothetical protein
VSISKAAEARARNGSLRSRVRDRRKCVSELPGEGRGAVWLDEWRGGEAIDRLLFLQSFYMRRRTVG